MNTSSNTQTLVRLITVFECVADELTYDERNEFQRCFALGQQEQRELEFERLMQRLVLRLRESNSPVQLS